MALKLEWGKWDQGREAQVIGREIVPNSCTFSQKQTKETKRFSIEWHVSVRWPLYRLKAETPNLDIEKATRGQVAADLIGLVLFFKNVLHGKPASALTK
jgi:hypothetical protein